VRPLPSRLARGGVPAAQANAVGAAGVAERLANCSRCGSSSSSSIRHSSKARQQQTIGSPCCWLCHEALAVVLVVHCS
jgi:hypothetical protein